MTEHGAVNPGGTGVPAGLPVEPQGDPVATLIAQLREAKEKKAAAEALIDELKAELFPYIEQLGGSWKDDQGYARINKPKGGNLKADAAAIDQQVSLWEASSDPTWRLAGNTIRQHLSYTAPGKPYISFS